MHERYLFPSLTLLAPLVGWPFARRAYVALSALFLVNLWFPYAYYNLQWQVGALAGQPLFSWVFGGLTTFETTQRRLLSLVTVCLCLLIAARVKAWTSEPGVALATSEPPGGDTAAW